MCDPVVVVFLLVSLGLCWFVLLCVGLFVSTCGVVCWCVVVCVVCWLWWLLRVVLCCVVYCVLFGVVVLCWCVLICVLCCVVVFGCCCLCYV